MIKTIQRAIEKKRQEEQGFTLVELIVVVIILGILAAIAIPIFIGQQNAAESAAAKANVASAKIAASSYIAAEPGTAVADTAVATTLNSYGWPVGTPTVTPGTGISADGKFTFTAAGGGDTWTVTESTAPTK